MIAKTKQLELTAENHRENLKWWAFFKIRSFVFCSVGISGFQLFVSFRGVHSKFDDVISWTFLDLGTTSYRWMKHCPWWSFSAKLRLITNYPKLLYALIGIPALCHMSLVICFSVMFPKASFNAFTLATLLLYSLLAATCVFLLGDALRCGQTWKHVGKKTIV